MKDDVPPAGGCDEGAPRKQMRHTAFVAGTKTYSTAPFFETEATQKVYKINYIYMLGSKVAEYSFLFVIFAFQNN